MEKIVYKTALVLGLGASGAAAAKLLLDEETSVTVVDASDNPELRKRAQELEEEGGRVLLGSKTVPDDEFSICIVSPGVPSDSNWVRRIEDHGTEVLAELELAWRRCGCRVLAVTGSNGKSTAAKLCRDALAEAGCRTELAGNYGLPISTVVLNHRELDWLVLEVSSFQLERVVEFRPDVGMLLNLFPNHLDRHGDMETYARIKRRLFARMKQDDIAVIPADMLDTITSFEDGKNRWVTFGSSDGADCVYRSGCVTCRELAGRESGRGSAARESEVSFTGTSFDNEILGIVAAGSVAAIRACGCSAEHVVSAARSFRALPHRMEEVREIRGVKFVDDSKATNIAALSAALKISKRPVRLIAGGLLKEKDLLSVKELLARKVAAVYLMGESMGAMEAAWQHTVSCCRCRDLAEAVRTAWKEAQEGEVVLLSPACASFDQFKSFEDRGEQFVKLVSLLNEEE